MLANSHPAPETDRHITQHACRAAQALPKSIHRGMQATIACQTSSSCFGIGEAHGADAVGTYDLLHMMWCSCVPQPLNALETTSIMPYAQAKDLTMHALFISSQTQPHLLPLPGIRAAEQGPQVSQTMCLVSRSKTSISYRQHLTKYSHSIAIAHAFFGLSGARAHVLHFTAAAWSPPGCARSALCRPQTDSTPPDPNAASSAPPPYWPPAQPMHGPAH